MLQTRSKSRKAPMFDLWSIGHFVSGTVLAILGVSLFWIFFLGIAWEILEHSLLKPLANLGGKEGWDNIIADIILVFLGGFSWILFFG